MFAGMADPSVVFQLDALFVGLTLLTLLHAIAHRGVVAGTTVVAYLAFHTAAFEHISLFLGQSHPGALRLVCWCCAVAARPCLWTCIWVGGESGVYAKRRTAGFPSLPHMHCPLPIPFV